MKKWFACFLSGSGSLHLNAVAYNQYTPVPCVVYGLDTLLASTGWRPPRTITFVAIRLERRIELMQDTIGFLTSSHKIRKCPGTRRHRFASIVDVQYCHRGLCDTFTNIITC
jgi:hypothetical protein